MYLPQVREMSSYAEKLPSRQAAHCRSGGRRIGVLSLVAASAIALGAAGHAVSNDICHGEKHIACDEEWLSKDTDPDLFGNPAISGRWAILGKRGDDEAVAHTSGMGAGAVYFYRKFDGRWQFWSKMPHPAPASGGFEWLGHSVAMDGNLAAASAPGWDNKRGRILVFERDLDTGEWDWVDHLFLEPPFGQENDQLGGGGDRIGREAVAVSGDIIAGGAPRGDDEAGYVAIFQNGQQQVINSSDFGLPPQQGARFGSVVVLDDDRLEIGEPDREGGGRAYVARHEGGQWIGEGVLQSPEGGGNGSDAANPGFGFSAALDGDLLVVSKAQEERVYLFDYDHPTGTWHYSGVKLVNPLPPDPESDFGVGLALSGSHLLVGDSLMQWAFLYGREPDGQWELRRTIAPEEQPFGPGYFGFSLALADDGAIIAAWNESHVENGTVVVPKGGVAYFFRWLPTCDPYDAPCGF